MVLTNKVGRTGEITAGYADGCLSREQTVLIAYHRGRMAPDHGLSGGMMAAVGLGAGAAEARIHKAGFADSGVVVACDNSPDSVTVSGGLFLHLIATLLVHSRSPQHPKGLFVHSGSPLLRMRCLLVTLCSDDMQDHQLLGTETRCHNGDYLIPVSTCSAFAGPSDALSPLLAALKTEGIFVREVDTLGIAYHSPALLPFAEDLRAGKAA